MRFWLELNQEKDYGQIPVLNQNGKAEFFILSIIICLLSLSSRYSLYICFLLIFVFGFIAISISLSRRAVMKIFMTAFFV